MALSPATEWLTNKEITITDSGSVSAGYQMSLVVYSGIGSDDVSNGIIYCNNYCEDFPNDIRFGTTNDESAASQYTYWVETKDSTECKIWVKLQADDTLYMFVGNTTATDEGSGDDVFVWFDDCETGVVGDNWVVHNDTGTSSSYETTNPYNGSKSIYQIDTSTSNYTRVTLTLDSSLTDARVGWRLFHTDTYTQSSDDAQCYIYDSAPVPICTTYYRGDGDIDYYDGSIHDTGVDHNIEAWNEVEYRMISSTDYVHFFCNGEDSGDILRTSFSNVDKFLLQTSSGYRGQHYWDNIYVALYSATPVTWNTFGLWGIVDTSIKLKIAG